MLKTISVPVLVASLLASPAIAAGSAAKAPVDTTTQATAAQSVAKSDADTSAKGKKAKKTKKVTKDKTS